ncbi:hypothetical protein AOCH_000173, partial [Aspergillus ochraceoroseus]
MPRPKVLPENRLRAVKACRQCRASKKRCTGTAPCPNCVRRGCAGKCIVSDSEPDSSSHDAASFPSDAAFSAMATSPPLIQHPPIVSPAVTASSSDHGSCIHANDPQSYSPNAPHHTYPRLLRSVCGEQVYIGNEASLSFLQLLRDLVTQYMGPSSFSNNSKRDTMLEEERKPQEIFVDDPLNLDQKAVLVQVYLIATSGILHVVSSSEALRILKDSASPTEHHNPCRAATGDLMIAIGAQCTTNDEPGVGVERFYFLRGQRRAFEGSLEHPSVDLVRAFVLLAFYMMGACQRNAASMYLGVAARAAAILGLHSCEYHGMLGEPERQRRLRVWASLRTLDLISSSILGRPAATSTPRSHSQDQIASQIEQAGFIDIFLLASYQGSQIIEEIVGTIYGEKSVSTDTAQALLQRLRNWTDEFYHALQKISVTDSSSREQGYALGKLHVACLYYWAVTLVTRPFLVSVLTSRLSRSARPDSIIEDPMYLTLAFSCVDSAVYLLQGCREMLDAGLMLANVSLLKAFIFAASLVVGFLMFSGRDVSLEVEEAFASAQELLQMLARRSPQAAHYNEILCLLATVIAEQRQRLNEQAARSRSQYVNRIFIFDQDRPSTSTAMHRDPVDDWMRETLFDPPTSGAFLGWDSLDLPLWDNFPFNPNCA